jgi:hypothetical protein
LFSCLDCPGLFLCLYSTTHNTNIHVPGGVRARNPSKRSAADPRLRPLASGIGKWTPYSNFVHYFTSCRWLEWWHRVAVTGTNGSHITRCHTVKMLSGGLSSVMRTETEGWVSLSLVEVNPVGLELGRISIVEPHVNLM